MSRKVAALGFLASIALPAAFGHWQLGIALTAVVTLHELGHAIAMRLAGYRDVRVYFVPLLGGAAAGDGRGVSIHREALVLLAGPMPGLFLSVGAVALDVLVFEGPRLWSLPLAAWTIWFGLALNYLNLLPAFPLDGGRLVHRIVSGHAWLETAVLGASGVALLGLGLWAGDPFSGVVGGWLILVARRNHRLAGVEAALRARGVDRLPTEARLAACFAALDGVRGWGPRAGLVHQVDRRLAASPSSLRARVGWGAVYVLCLAIALPYAWLTSRAHEISARDAETDVWTE